MSGFDVQMRSDAMIGQAKQQGLALEMQAAAGQRQAIAQAGAQIQQQQQFNAQLQLRERESDSRMRLQEAEIERQQSLTKLGDARMLIEAEQHKTAMQMQKLALEQSQFNLDEAKRNAQPEQKAQEYLKKFYSTPEGRRFGLARGKIYDPKTGTEIDDPELAKSILEAMPQERAAAVAERGVTVQEQAGQRAEQMLPHQIAKIQADASIAKTQQDIAREELEIQRARVELERNKSSLTAAQIKTEQGRLSILQDRLALDKEIATNQQAIAAQTADREDRRLALEEDRLEKTNAYNQSMLGLRKAETEAEREYRNKVLEIKEYDSETDRTYKERWIKNQAAATEDERRWRMETLEQSRQRLETDADIANRQAELAEFRAQVEMFGQARRLQIQQDEVENQARRVESDIAYNTGRLDQASAEATARLDQSSRDTFLNLVQKTYSFDYSMSGEDMGPLIELAFGTMSRNDQKNMYGLLQGVLGQSRASFEQDVENATSRVGGEPGGEATEAAQPEGLQINVSDIATDSASQMSASALVPQIRNAGFDLRQVQGLGTDPQAMLSNPGVQFAWLQEEGQAAAEAYKRHVKSTQDADITVQQAYQEIAGMLKQNDPAMLSQMARWYQSKMR